MSTPMKSIMKLRKGIELILRFRAVWGDGALATITFWCAVAYLTIVLMLTGLKVMCLPILTTVLCGALAIYCLSHWPKLSEYVSVCAPGLREGAVGKFFVVVAVIYGFLALSAPLQTNPDALTIWKRAMGELPLDDWHPVIYTFMLSTFGRMLRSYRLVVFVQSVGFVALLYWLFVTLLRWQINWKVALGVVCCMAISPFSIAQTRILLKDSAFGLCGLALTIVLINMVESEGRWLNWRTGTLFSILLVYSTFLRHNGMFYSVPVILFSFFAVMRGRRIKLLGFVALAFLMMVGYVGLKKELIASGRMLDVGQEQRLPESIGLPLSMMSEAYVKDPESTPGEVCRFLEQICPRDIWVRSYEGDFNSVKYGGLSSRENYRKVVNEIGAKRFFDFFFKTVCANPKSAIRSFLNVTSIAWSPFPEDIEKTVSGSGVVGWDVYCLSILSMRLWIGRILSAPGMYLLVLMIAFQYGLPRRGTKVFVYALPLFSYQFGTMLFLTGADYRFFWIVIVCALPLSVMLMKDQTAKKRVSRH